MRVSEHIRCQHIANVVCFFLVLILAAVFTLRRVDAVHRGFFCDDEDIRYPHHEDTISVGVLFITCSIPAFVMIFVLETVYGILTPRYRGSKDGSTPADEESRCGGLRHGLGRGGLVFAALVFGNALCFNVTEIFKLSFGHLRPNFLSACQPEVDVTLWSNCSGLFITDVKCMNSDTSLVIDIRKSFLSGHASFVTMNMGFIMLYLQLRLPLSSPRLVKSLLQCVALGFGVFVCGSRILDNMHYLQDIVAGFVLGALFAVYTVYKICPRFMRQPPRAAADVLPVTNPNKAYTPQVTSKIDHNQVNCVKERDSSFRDM